MFTISLLHPFTSKAVGLTEDDLLSSHSKPHLVALKSIQMDSITITIDYFTNSFFAKKKLIDGVGRRFWPVSFSSRIKKAKWRNESSWLHYRNARKYSADVTIINMSGHGSNYVFKLAKMLRSNHKPYIAMVGGLGMSYTGEAYEYYKNAHHIIVHTQNQKEDIQRQIAFRDFDIRVLPLGMDTTKFLPAVQSKNNLMGDLLYVGRISRLKQIEIALQTIAYLVKFGFPNANLTIIGPKSDETYYKELILLIETLGIKNNIHFSGSIAHSNLIDFYQNAELLLMPSSHESFGMVITEAMSCGLPVIALSGAGGPDEIIQNDINGILTSKDQFPISVLQVLNDWKKYHYLSLNSREAILNNYSLGKTTQVLKSSIEDALKSKI